MKYVKTDELGEDIYKLEEGEYCYYPKCKVQVEDPEYLICNEKLLHLRGNS